MTETMLERMAIAASGSSASEWFGERPQYRDAWRDKIRAALDVAKAPDDAVLAAMDKARPLWSPPSCDNKRELIMSRNLPKAQAFVDAILSQSTKEPS